MTNTHRHTSSHRHASSHSNSHTGNRSIINGNPFMGVFKAVVAGTLGYISTMAIVALYTLTFLGIGLYLINTYNKENTDIFKELQAGQYIGIVLCVIGLLPFLQYFIIGFIMEIGKNLADDIF